MHTDVQLLHPSPLLEHERENILQWANKRQSYIFWACTGEVDNWTYHVMPLHSILEHSEDIMQIDVVPFRAIYALYTKPETMIFCYWLCVCEGGIPQKPQAYSLVFVQTALSSSRLMAFFEALLTFGHTMPRSVCPSKNENNQCLICYCYYKWWIRAWRSKHVQFFLRLTPVLETPLQSF